MMILIKWFPLLVLLLSLVVDVFVNAFAFQHSTPAGYGALIRGKRPLSASFIEAENEMSETKPAINQPATASAKVFLKELLSFTGSSEQKKELLQKAREAGSSKSRWSMEPSFDTLLAEVYNEENNKPIFNFRYPIPVPSYRVKLARLRRVMDAYMEDDDTGSDAETKKARALVGALAQAAGARGGVWGLEREALASANGRALTMADMLKRTPDLETPSYTVLLANPRQQWELREYAAFSVVSLAMPGGGGGGGGEGGGGGGGEDRPGVQTTAPAAASAFNQLAGYIFGKNQEGEKMAMTTPVISSVPNDDEAAAREMSFVMPSKFWAPEALGAAPTPLAPEGGGPGVAVRPARMGGGGGGAGCCWAAKWFGGYCTGAVRRGKLAELRAQLAAPGGPLAPGGGWEPDPTQEAAVLQYNDPFQPPWKRRNEVALPLRRVVVGEAAAPVPRAEVTAVADWGAAPASITVVADW